MRSPTTLVLTLVLAGCSYMGATESPTITQAIHTAAAEATATIGVEPATTPQEVTSTPTAAAAAATAVPSEEPTVPPTPFVIPEPSLPVDPPDHVAGLEHSDRFWSHFIDDCFFGVGELPPSLAAVYRAADIVVRGHIDDLYIGEYWAMEVAPDRYPLAYLRVAIDEVLKGQPAMRQDGFVEVQIGHWYEQLDAVRHEIPDDDYLWFLTWDGNWPRDHMNQSEIAPYAYFAPDYKIPTVIRGIDGTIQVLKPDWVKNAYGRRHYPLPVDGTPFDAFVDRVRDFGDDSGMTASSARAVLPRRAEPTALFAC